MDYAYTNLTMAIMKGSLKVNTASYPWPFPDRCITIICGYAGREASAALCIALGKKTGALAAHQATNYEPSTYWDLI
jgi:hypothetical protein